MGDEDQRLDHIAQHVYHQAGKADQGQHQADAGEDVHEGDGVVHLFGAILADGLAPSHHLVEQADQGGQIRLDGVRIVILGLGRAVLMQLQRGARGRVEGAVQGFDLGTQPIDLGIADLQVTVEPFSQHAAAVVHAAGEIVPRIEGVAQVDCPLVMSDLRLLGGVEQGVGLDASGRGALEAKDVRCGDAAEQKDREHSESDSDADGSVDTFTHWNLVLLRYFVGRAHRNRTRRSPRPSSYARRGYTERRHRGHPASSLRCHYMIKPERMQ